MFLQVQNAAAAPRNQEHKMYVLIVVAIILCLLFKVLNVNNSPEKSLFYCCNADFLDQILKHAPILGEP